MINKNRYLYYSILPCCLLLIVIGVYAYGWETPGCDPPGCNLPAPINAGLDPQTKAGNLTIDSLLKVGRYSSAPTGSTGALYYDTTANEFKGYKASSWDSLGGASLWTKTGNDIYYNTGNVGIGTTAPSNSLVVRDSVSAYNRDVIRWERAADGAVAGVLGTGKDSTNNVFVGSITNHPLKLQTNNLTRVTILEGGNVGIGTTIPQTKLDVAGAIKIGTQDTCNSNNEGAIRYVSGTKKFEGCNGVSWKLIASVPTWDCGSSVTFTYKGVSVTYGTVLNPTTGACWLDRNLGALQVATSQTDANAYGDLFQWGRLADGHQTRTSGKTTTLSSTDNPGHSNFIYDMGSPYNWRSPQNDNLWQGLSDVNNPCPSGWRIPTSAEAAAERASWSPDNSTGAYASPLKLTMAGLRHWSGGGLMNVGTYGFIWTSTASGTNADVLQFWAPNASFEGRNRAMGFSVRCIKD